MSSRPQCGAPSAVLGSPGLPSGSCGGQHAPSPCWLEKGLAPGALVIVRTLRRSRHRVSPSHERSPVGRCCLGRQCERRHVPWLGFVPHSQQQRPLPAVPNRGCTRTDASWVACGSGWRSEGTLRPWDYGASPHLWVTFLTPWEGLRAQSGALYPLLGVKGAAGSGSACRPSTHGLSPGASPLCLGTAVGRQVCSPPCSAPSHLGRGVRGCGHVRARLVEAPLWPTCALLPCFGVLIC